jgi:LPS-assembly lipoprotein
MSWYRSTLIVGLLIAAQSLQACGFQPLYQRDQTGIAVSTAFESIRVRPIADRVGQELRNHLYDALTPKGQPINPAWELDVTLDESIQMISVEQTSFSTRANLELTGLYSLKFIANTEVLGHEGAVTVISSYNIFDSEYATLVAERDARSRAVMILCNDIRRQLAIWFNNQGP